MVKKQSLRFKWGIAKWRIWAEDAILKNRNDVEVVDETIEDLERDLSKLSKFIETSYPVYVNSASAIIGGLEEGDVFKTPAGAVSIVTINRVASITTTDDTKILTPEDTFDFAATITIEPDYADDKTVTYQSDDELVATVSNVGLITAVAEGEATITAIAGEMSCMCRVTVEDAG